MTIEQLEKELYKAAQEYAEKSGRMIESISFEWREGMGISPYLVRLKTDTSTCSTYHGVNHE